MRSTLRTLMAAILVALSPIPAPAQTAAAPPVLQGRTLEGQPFDIAMLRGKVVLVMFWSTGCAVCRDKMPELRANYQGWRGKPFELVLVGMDRQPGDLVAYESIIGRLVPLQQQFVQLWGGDPQHRDGFGKPAQLPTAFLLDKAGRVVERWQGRIPAEAWDRIADLL